MSDSSASFGLTLASGCRVLAEAAEGPVLETPGDRVPLARTSGGGTDADLGVEIARRLLAGKVTESSLVAEAAAIAGYEGVGQLYSLLYALHERLLLGRSVETRTGPLLTGWPLNAQSAFAVDPVASDRRWRLSRFAAIRRLGDQLVLESPRSGLSITLDDERAVGLLSRLAQPCTAEQLAAAVDLDCGTARCSLDLLGHCQLVVQVGEDGATDEDQLPLRSWQHHDLLFHARSRFGSHAGGYGGTRRFAGQDRPPSTLMPEASVADTIELYRPDPEALERSDPPLARVMAQRRTWRDHGEPALDVRQLGELLFRTARVVEVIDGDPYSVARRPYPGGGGAYELEFYPIVGGCQSLEPGLYRYLPASHRLSQIGGATPEVQRLLANAGHIAGVVEPVQVLLVLAARFRRMSWKYESMAYATILKDVGVVYQTIYLAATAMGLGACGLGGGDSQTFARAAGLDANEQTSVGEILLASQPRPPGRDVPR